MAAMKKFWKPFKWPGSMSATNALNLNEVKAQARALATRLTPTSCVLLHGTLGVGKTTFAQALIGALTTPGIEVTSPTFTLVQDYPVTLSGGQACTLYHADLYRLNHWHELEELGIGEWLSGAPCMIEWPEKLGPYMPSTRIDVVLEMTGEYTRNLRICFQE
jgi:tRNA threonylcarbamoyladenosine biosynthesis protein TsaE